MTCKHERMKPDVFDQTLGVACPDCNLMAWCWAENHCSEALWNLACKNDPDFSPTEQSREDYCSLCDERISTSDPIPDPK